MLKKYAEDSSYNMHGLTLQLSQFYANNVADLCILCRALVAATKCMLAMICLSHKTFTFYRSILHESNLFMNREHRLTALDLAAVTIPGNQRLIIARIVPFILV